MEETVANVPTFAVRTLGCRVNQYESRALADTLARAGWCETGVGAAAHVIVNVCAVTDRGSRKARRSVYQSCRGAPGRRVYVMGCATARDRAAYLALPEVRAVVPPPAREKLVEILTGTEAPLALRSFGARTRAYVKIQDGCSRACTYCIVPLLRGRSASRPAVEIVEECRALLSSGVPEIWLVGTRMEEWGGGTLPALVDRVGALLDGTSNRVRIGSLGLDALAEDLLASVARRRGICRHFHLSLQSGSERVRRRMGRRLTPDEIRARVRRCREVLADVTFTGDILVGFPGEDTSDFEATYALAREIAFVKMHIFPFSPRPGTRAAEFAPRVPEEVAAERCARLAALGEELFVQEAGKLIGRTLAVVVERAGQVAEGFAEQYVRVRFPARGCRKGDLRHVRAVDLREQALDGEIIL